MRHHLQAWICSLVCLTAIVQAGDAPDATPRPLIDLLGRELDYGMTNLAMPDGTKPYFIAYTVTEERSISIGAELGALAANDETRERMLDVDVRVGDHKIDNTHKIRGAGFGFDPSEFFRRATPISLEDDPDALRQTLWLATDRVFKSAAKKYQQVVTNLKTKVEEEDKSDDFSKERPSVHYEPAVTLHVDRAAWAERLRQVSRIALDHPLIYDSGVMLSAAGTHRYMVTSEGTNLQTAKRLLRVTVYAQTRANDGMELSQSQTFDAFDTEGLPETEELAAAFMKVIERVLALREAPLVEPYTGPAILRNRAAGVFFHEIFGHRIEGHRQKDVEEGQTFTKKIGEEVLPTFLSVHDDPSRCHFGEQDLRGYYKFDDEGVPSTDVVLVENGILKTFLLSRSPVEGFPVSNGHGRRSPGRDVVGRQGNLIVESAKTVPFDELRQMLIDECKKQERAFGYVFEDITGGFTGTSRFGAQSFKVLPVVVYRVYTDGREDELVRGVDIVGTPLTSFSKIIYTGDDPDVFNGTCGAESGWVPVSAVSPSLLVSQIEIEKRTREQEKPPILDAPIAKKGM